MNVRSFEPEMPPQTVARDTERSEEDDKKQRDEEPPDEPGYGHGV